VKIIGNINRRKKKKNFMTSLFDLNIGFFFKKIK
jgi:hypothetical protein